MFVAHALHEVALNVDDLCHTIAKLHGMFTLEEVLYM